MKGVHFEQVSHVLLIINPMKRQTQQIKVLFEEWQTARKQEYE